MTGDTLDLATGLLGTHIPTAHVLAVGPPPAVPGDHDHPLPLTS
ncbi:hypothetical protein [Streptomyces sp. WAC05374]|nr:hypothetical protein [Streptomyces sp. WAC05374]